MSQEDIQSCQVGCFSFLKPELYSQLIPKEEGGQGCWHAVSPLNSPASQGVCPACHTASKQGAEGQEGQQHGKRFATEKWREGWAALYGRKPDFPKHLRDSYQC